MMFDLKEYKTLIPPQFRKRGVIVAITLLLRALLNFVGLAILLPVIALVIDPKAIEQQPIVKSIYEAFGFSTPQNFALTVCAVVVVVITLKCGANIWLGRFERNYIYDLYRALSRRLYITYHNRGLGFIKGKNSSQLTRNVNVVCLAFTAGVLRPTAAIFADMMLLLLLLTALAIYTPLAAGLAVGCFTPAVWFYYRIVRKRITTYGEEENRAQREKSRIVSETFRGYADIEINGAFGMMLKGFDNAMDKVVETRSKEFTIALLPQSFTEVGVAGGIALLAALTIGGQSQNSALLFGAFAIAALRIMPSVRGILSAWGTMKYNRYTIDILRESEAEISGLEINKEICEPMRFDDKIEVRGLTFEFEDGKDLFHGLDLIVRKGERVGIRGASGAGKTTLFNLLLGLYQPNKGKILIDGVELTMANKTAWHSHIGYVSQNLFLVDGSFAANVAIGVEANQIDKGRIRQALETAQMWGFIEQLDKGIDTHIGECGCRLSGGQRQRIGIARALYRRADVLFFDEATSALDNQTEEQINCAIADLAASQMGLTMVVIAHRESSLTYCNRIITL